MTGQFRAEFGRRLRALRKERGLTQRELAERVGLDFTYISKIENGLVPYPSEEAIIKIAQVLGVPEEELLLLAQKISPSWKEDILKGKELPEFLRLKHSLSDEDAEQLEREFAELIARWKRKERA